MRFFSCPSGRRHVPAFRFFAGYLFLCLHRHWLIASSHPDPDHAALRLAKD